MEKNQRTPWTETNSGRKSNLMLSQMLFLIKSLKKIKSLEMKPRLNCRSPYLGKATRHRNNLLNTEFKKVNKSIGKLEADCRFMTEEGILEMLSSEKLKKVKSVAKSCNIATKGSKLDILLKIKEVKNENDAKFK